MSWVELRAMLRWLGRESAYYRSMHPRSYWYTPEVAALEKLGYVLACANWQRAGGKGEKPKPPTPPVDREASIKTVDDLEARKRKQREHLQRRRAQIAKGG